MKIVFLSLLFLFFANTVLAQPDTEPGDDKTEDEESLDLFDSDVEDTKFGWSQLSVSLGYMPLSADGTWKMELPGGQQVTVLDLDRLGLDDDDTSYWMTVNWRNHDSRWGAWFAAWQYDVAGYRVWEHELEIDDDLLIPVGAGVVSELDAKWYILEATYSFARTKNFDAGIGFGLHAVDLDTRLAGRFSIGEQEFEAINQEFDFLAPLPNVLGYVYWKFAERWRLTTRIGWFGLSYDKYDGQMTNLHALLRYELSERWAIDAGYQFVKLDVDIEEDNYTSMFDIDFYGPMFAVRFNF
jgi:hypothetical protein